MKRRSIRSRLVTRLAALLLTLAVGTDAGLYVYLRGELIEQYDNSLQTQGRAVASVWQAAQDSRLATETILRDFPNLHFGRPQGDYLWRVLENGVVDFRLPAVERGALSTFQPPDVRTRRRIFDLTLPNGRSGRAVWISIGSTRPQSGHPNSPSAAATLVLAEDRREMDRTLTSFGLWLFLIGGCLSAVSIWLVLVAVQDGLRPLDTFSEAVERLDAESLGRRFTVDGLPAELTPMATRLNDLLSRLESAFDRERRFTGNVAHELRTPLAELRSMVEVAMKWPPGPAELHRHHGHLLDVIRRMSTMTQTLLTLVRHDRGKIGVTVEAVELMALLKVAALPHERAAAARQVGFDVRGPAAVLVAADTAVLPSLLDNLFSNAALYATPGSRVSCDVAMDEAGRAAVLQLTNATTDLVADDLARLHEPFWRKDAARSQGDHAGLGLTLVRTYASALGVNVLFDLPVPGSFRVTVTLPVAAGSPDLAVV